jgi:hypothetical protein
MLQRQRIFEEKTSWNLGQLPRPSPKPIALPIWSRWRRRWRRKHRCRRLSLAFSLSPSSTGRLSNFYFKDLLLSNSWISTSRRFQTIDWNFESWLSTKVRGSPEKRDVSKKENTFLNRNYTQTDRRNWNE